MRWKPHVRFGGRTGETGQHERLALRPGPTPTRGDYRETWETETLWTSLHVETLGRIRGGLRALLRAAIDGAGGYAELAKAAGVDEPDLL